MDRQDHTALVARFRAAHAAGHLLVLPNAWDAATARLFEQSGAGAIATPSAALSWAHGYPDGEHLPLETLVAAVAEITRVVSVPVTVDLERGYSDAPEGAAAAVLRVIEVGAAGVNLEDGGAPAELLARKIHAVRAAASARGADVFINARTDVYLRRLVPPERAVHETLTRARLYADAGCDGLFVPMATALDDLEAIAQGCPLPVNVLAIPGIAPVAALQRRGVRRLSVGPGLAEVAFAAARRACVELLEHGTYASLFATDVTYAAMNALFPPR